MKKIFLVLAAALLVLTSCGNNKQDIINPDADFKYFYGATCPHCQELNKKVEEEDLFSEISVEKREVYFNDTNRELFLETIKELGLEEANVGVPFVLHKATGEYTIGVDNAYELFKKDFSIATENEENNKVEEEAPITEEEEAVENNTGSVSE